MFEPKKPPKKPTVVVLWELPREFRRLGSSYPARRGAHPALAPYPTLDSLVAKLTVYTPESKDERLVLIAALIQIHRKSGHRVWTALLLRVFRPMLNRIRGKLVGPDAEELDVKLVSSFFEALQVVDTKEPTLIPALVRWRTRRFVFRQLKAQTKWEELGFGEDSETEVDPATECEPFLIGVWLRDAKVDAESIELVRTLFEHGALWTLVRSRFAGLSPEEQRAAYSRLRARRQVLVERLQRGLQPESQERSGVEKGTRDHAPAARMSKPVTVTQGEWS